MTKAELVEAIMAHPDKPYRGRKGEVEQVIDLSTKLITAALVNDEDVRLPGLGTFKTADRAGREGRNPKTGEAIKIPPKTVVKFSAAKALKEALNG